MLTSVEFENYRAFRSASCQFGKLTLIVGPNASGKSSVLRGVQQLARLAPGATEELRLSRSDCFKGSGEERYVIRASVQESQVAGALHLNVNFKMGGTTHAQASGSVTCDGAGASLFIVNGGAGTDAFSMSPPFNVNTDKLLAVLSAAPQAIFLRLEPSLLAGASSSDAPFPDGDFTGVGLSAVLVDMATRYTERYTELLQGLQTIVPSVDRIHLRRGMFGGVAGREVRFDFRSGSDLGPSHASVGTLIALGILAIGFSPSRPRLVLLDELERGLHPQALKQLVGYLRRIVEIAPGTQIVATTHSPYLVDHFNYDEIRVTSILPDGSATIASLDEHPDIDRWKDAMLPGEFWSSTGEKWVAEKAAKAAAK